MITFHDKVKNPIIISDDIDEPWVKFVADPFLAYDHGTYHLFYEVLKGGDYYLPIRKDGDEYNLFDLFSINWKNREYSLNDFIAMVLSSPRKLTDVRRDGMIGLATSKDGLNWSTDGIVLREYTHLAYPYVFNHNGKWYMTPDKGMGEFRIYRASSFPNKWELIETPLSEISISDPTLIYHHETWCAFFADEDGTVLYYADHLENGNWTPHPENPISTADYNLRPAGRPYATDEKLIFFFQDCRDSYGSGISVYEISELSKTSYDHTEIGYLEGGQQWNQDGLHNIDMSLRDEEGIVAVDGKVGNLWSVGICEDVDVI
jgi:hypothetical protein